MNNLWMENYPKLMVQHLRIEELDHYPILSLMNKKTFKGIRPFRFLQVWTTGITSIRVVNDAWNLDAIGGLYDHRLSRSLQDTSRALWKWNIEVFGYAQSTIKDLDWELKTMQKDNIEYEMHMTILDNLRM